MNPANYTFLLDRSPWNRRWFSCALALIALVIHYAAGPTTVFPFLFVPPIMLTAWHSGPPFAIGLAVMVSLIRWSFYFVWSPPGDLHEANLSALMRCLMLILIALLTARVGRLQRVLQHRVKTLEHLLPICSFCKRIRDEHGVWKPMEVYISSHTDTQFSHSFCPECGQKHYPELFLREPEHKAKAA